ncbi:MAG: hypothetical protein N4A49_10530 [Marinifilaceae bacterium]|jgi:hypothetical protein|nr:hypothetical protein [Marinifilaceae bacterium]
MSSSFRKIGIYLFHFFIIVSLTILSQIGGLVYILSLFISKKVNIKFKGIIVFLLLYFISNQILIPIIAKFNDREQIEYNKHLQSGNILFKLLNRNYVHKDLNKLLTSISTEISSKNSDIVILCLDANFPFIDGFPLLPHFSHNDGKKIDLALIYENNKGRIVSKLKSNSGYGNFENPVPGELNTCKIAKSKGYFQYDYPKYLSLGRRNNDLNFSITANRLLMSLILKHNQVEKIFLEPHLVKRIGMQSNKVRFQGYMSVRHDDHIHIQIK